MNRNRMLRQWAADLSNAAQRGHLTSQPCSIASIQPISGPRAGALEILAGLHAGDLLRALRRNDGATLRQFIPWEFKGEPQVYMRGRYLRVEAGWSDALANDTIRLEELSPKPDGGGRWVAGQAETGLLVIIAGAGCASMSTGPEAASVRYFKEHYTRTPFKDLQTSVLRNDGTFAQVEVSVKFRPRPESAWQDEVAVFELANVDGQWTVQYGGSFRPLEEVLEQREEERAREQTERLRSLIDITVSSPQDNREARQIEVPVTVHNKDTVERSVTVHVSFKGAWPVHGVWSYEAETTVTVPAQSTEPTVAIAENKFSGGEYERLAKDGRYRTTTSGPYWRILSIE